LSVHNVVRLHLSWLHLILPSQFYFCSIFSRYVPPEFHLSVLDVDNERHKGALGLGNLYFASPPFRSTATNLDAVFSFGLDAVFVATNEEWAAPGIVSAVGYLNLSVYALGPCSAVSTCGLATKNDNQGVENLSLFQIYYIDRKIW